VKRWGYVECLGEEEEEEGKKGRRKIS